MATVQVSAYLIEEIVFGFADHDVKVTGALYDSRTGNITFDIEGKDVPADADEVRAVVSETRNRAGDRLRHMTFEKV